MPWSRMDGVVLFGIWTGFTGGYFVACWMDSNGPAAGRAGRYLIDDWFGLVWNGLPML